MTLGGDEHRHPRPEHRTTHRARRRPDGRGQCPRVPARTSLRREVCRGGVTEMRVEGERADRRRVEDLRAAQGVGRVNFLVLLHFEDLVDEPSPQPGAPVRMKRGIFRRFLSVRRQMACLPLPAGTIARAARKSSSLDIDGWRAAMRTAMRRATLGLAVAAIAGTGLGAGTASASTTRDNGQAGSHDSSGGQDGSGGQGGAGGVFAASNQTSGNKSWPSAEPRTAR